MPAVGRQDCGSLAVAVAGQGVREESQLLESLAPYSKGSGNDSGDIRSRSRVCSFSFAFKNGMNRCPFLCRRGSRGNSDKPIRGKSAATNAAHWWAQHGAENGQTNKTQSLGGIQSKGGLSAIADETTREKLAQRFEVHPHQIL